MSLDNLDDLAEPPSANVSLAKDDDLASIHSYASRSIQGKSIKTGNFENTAIQLIDFSRGFEVNPRAIEFLKSIKDEIIIVSVVGKARTGKSYLMNLLLDNVGKKNNGFKVASSLQSCTKGIWLWGTAKNSLNSGSNAKIIFLDSEGTSSTDKSTKTYDSRIFALVVLISSLFLYNTYSNIDEHGISELSLASHISDSITTNSNINKDDLLNELAPNFIWIIRDFSLDKVHPETGEEITSKEYLELCLKNKRCGKNSMDNNIIRQNIIKYFPERDCVTLIRPVDDEKDLKKLNEIPFNDLKSEFKIEFKKLKDKIYKESFPKKYNGKKLTGPSLANLIIEFVRVINSGKIPNINNTWDSVIEKDVSDAYNSSISYYTTKTNELSINQNNILDEDELAKKLGIISNNAVQNFNKLLENNSDTFKHENYNKMYIESKNRLLKHIETNNTRLINQNNSSSITYCNNLIIELYHPFEQKLFKDSYNTKNFKDIIEDLCDFLKMYDQKGKNPTKNNICFDFLSNKEKTIINSLQNIITNEGIKNINKLENNIKIAQADLDNVNNMQKVVDQKEKINNEKIKDTENELNKLNEEITDLNENLSSKQKQLNLIKQRNIQTRKNKQALADLEEEKKRKERLNSKKEKETTKCGCNIY